MARESPLLSSLMYSICSLIFPNLRFLKLRTYLFSRHIRSLTFTEPYQPLSIHTVSLLLVASGEAVDPSIQMSQRWSRRPQRCQRVRAARAAHALQFSHKVCYDFVMNILSTLMDLSEPRVLVSQVGPIATPFY